MRLRYYFLILFLTIAPTLSGQATRLSDQSQISVITCGTGDQLYAAFGHSAFRIQDPSRGIDLIYNYGTFDFNTPNFYLKFIRGALMYSLSRQRFENFLYTYQLENRWVKEQILDLTPKAKNEIFLYLENNYRPDNRYYKYEFIRENCSTKIPQVLLEVLGKELVFQADHLKDGMSFRQLIQSYLHWNSWASLGIDLALGTSVDHKAQAEEYMFLPDYVLLQINHTSYKEKPLLTRQRTILDLNSGVPVSYFTTSPLFWLLLLLVFTITITIIDFRNDTRSRWLDFVLLFISGTTGILILFLWIFSEYVSFNSNFNIAWAFPFNAVVAFYMIGRGKLRSWIPTYIKGLLMILGIVPILWLTGIQIFPPLALLILLTLALRYFYLFYYFKSVYPNWVRDVWKTKSN